MPSAKNIKMLIVDDQKSMLELTKYSLNQLGVDQVFEAKSAEQALEMLEETEVHLIISDVNMEGMSGVDFLKHVRRDAKLKDLPFVLASGVQDRDLVKSAIEAGVNNYITKPFNVATLKKKLEAVVGELQ